MIKELKNFELHHKVLTFIGIVAIVILFSRILTKIKDPNIFLRGYELHHFYFGLALLIVVVILLLFSKKHYLIHLSLAGVAIGLISDELIFISSKIRGEVTYEQTFFSTIVIGILVLIFTLMTYRLSKKR